MNADALPLLLPVLLALVLLVLEYRGKDTD